jgi:Ca-activated chloride channel family protein
VYAILAAAVLGFAVTDPQSFANLWLTPDQQGWLWYQSARYERAARNFDDPRWKGMSHYAGQDFIAAARYFSQYTDDGALLARANALAHAREYVDARDLYAELLQENPDNRAAKTNLAIVQKLIDANRELSESQRAEFGDMSAEQDKGPRSSEGAERMTLQEREQFTAEQLTADPELTQIWLRQVQRDPAEFLATKFYLQAQSRRAEQP